MTCLDECCCTCAPSLKALLVLRGEPTNMHTKNPCLRLYDNTLYLYNNKVAHSLYFIKLDYRLTLTARILCTLSLLK